MSIAVTADRLEAAIGMARDLTVELEELQLEVKALREQAPELVGAREAAELLGRHRNDFARMRAQGRIPAPIAELASGPVWLKAQFTFPNTLKDDGQ